MGKFKKELTLYTDHIESVAEELKLNGWSISINGKHIECDTIAGKMEYTCTEKTVMTEYYRFIYHFGLKLHKWGLKMKLNEYKNIDVRKEVEG